MSAYINLYEVGLGYGGAAEGGWWFEVRTPLSSKRIRGKCFSHRSVRELNRMREKHCFHSSRSKLYQSRRGSLLCYGGCRASDNHPREEAARFYSSFGDKSASIGFELLVCVEPHPAKQTPERRPRYE